MVHKFAVLCQRSISQGAFERSVRVVDPENRFKPERVVHIAERLKFHPNLILENIVTTRPNTSEQQIDVIEKFNQVGYIDKLFSVKIDKPLK